MIQEKFNITINLLKRYGECCPFLPELLAIYDTSLLVYSFFDKPSTGNTRKNVLAAYELRAAIKEGCRGGCVVEGYASLLTGLRRTRHAHICVSIFITDVGTFTIFSDFGREEMIGALFSPDAPDDTPVYSHLFMNGELLSRERE